jgi:hypothetical protein
VIAHDLLEEGQAGGQEEERPGQRVQLVHNPHDPVRGVGIRGNWPGEERGRQEVQQATHPQVKLEILEENITKKNLGGRFHFLAEFGTFHLIKIAQGPCKITKD